MSLTTEHTETKTQLIENKEQSKSKLLDGLKWLARGFWAYTEATSKTDIKSFDGWQ